MQERKHYSITVRIYRNVNTWNTQNGKGGDRRRGKYLTMLKFLSGGLLHDFFLFFPLQMSILSTFQFIVQTPL